MIEIIFFVVAFTFIAGLLIFFVGYETWKWRRWPKVSAIVLRYQITHGSEGRYYAPVVQFETVDGNKVVTVSTWSGWRRPWRRGDSIFIRYNPSQPRWCEPVCFNAVWGPTLTGIGLLLGFGIFAWFWGSP